MTEQDYKNHPKYVLGYHGILCFLLLVTLGGSVVNLYKSFGDPHRLYNAALILAIVFCLSFITWYCRIFPLKAQDRAIRAEENLRHFALTGKLFDPKLSIHQIIALRFAPDEEFVALTEKAVAENLSPREIKKSIKKWKADSYRL